MLEAWGLVRMGRDEFSAARRELSDGALERVGVGLYRVGPRLEGEPGWWQELAIACARRPDAVLCGPAAAAAYGLDGFDVGEPAALAIAPATSTRDERTVRRIRLLPPCTVHGLPVAAPGEALVDLGGMVTARPGGRAARAVLDPVDLGELAVESALRQELTSIEELQEVVARANRSRPGRRELAAVLARRPPGAVPTESYLETRVVQQLRDAGLPTFERQVWLRDAAGPIGRVDFHLDPIVIEAAGRTWHGDRHDEDNERYARLVQAGYTLIPVTFAHVEQRDGYLAGLVGGNLRRLGLWQP